MKKFSFLIYSLLCIGIGSTKAQYKDLLDFNGTNGANPSGSLILSGNKLYGMTSNGGINSVGNIFSIDTNGNGYKDLYDFNGVTGSNPSGSLTLSGNKLYGMTGDGGSTHNGNIFSIDTNGTGYKDLFQFNGTNGNGPQGSLTLSANTLYGMTWGGGAFSDGNIFSIDTSGSNFRDLFDFDGTDGSNPSGSLTIYGNKLYGMIMIGGLHNDGSVFSIDTNGSGYKDLLDFNRTNGYDPLGSLTFSKGILYGMTVNGGVTRHGNVFSIDTSGTNYKDLIDFNGTNGGAPRGSLTLSGIKLYGMTQYGGINGDGNIFMIDTNGTGYFNLLNFNNTNGANPHGDLTLSGGTLYGMTLYGGASGNGDVFKLYPRCNNYTEPICMVTIDTVTNKSEVIWGRTDSPPDTATSSYNIYRDSSSVYILLHNQHLNALSEYIDTGSDPSSGTTSYKVSTVDSCGESELSLAQTTSYLTVTAGINVFNLSWTPYVGFIPSEYRVYRGASTSTLAPIATIPVDTTKKAWTYTDTLPPTGSFYVIEVVNPAGACIPTHGPDNHLTVAPSGSFSNIVNTKTLGIETVSPTFSNVKVYPNPSNGRFTLNYSMGESANISISIINELGQVVYQEQKYTNNGQNTEQLNLESLASGIYSLSMKTNNGIRVQKLIIMK